MTDRVRQWLVTAGAICMVFGTLYGLGLIGTPVEQSSGGSLSAQATLLAPAVRAFSIWSVIYLGLIGYVIWQWLPAIAASPRARRIGWLSALSMALNGLWLLVVQVGALWLSVAVLAVGAVVGAILACVVGGRIGVAVAMSWGLFWIAVGRLTGQPSSDLAGVTAAIAAAVVVVAAALGRPARRTVTEHAYDH